VSGDRYLTPGDLLVVSGYVTDDVLADIVTISVLILINIYYKADPADFETWIDWIHHITNKTYKTISQLWKWLCQTYSLLAKQPMGSYTLQQVRRARCYSHGRNGMSGWMAGLALRAWREPERWMAGIPVFCRDQTVISLAE
jgi:hypothetical protein